VAEALDAGRGALCGLRGMDIARAEGIIAGRDMVIDDREPL
jgi:hypothetical protein